MEQKQGLIDIARADIAMAKLALSTSNDELMQNMAAYHTQQAIEKIIKQLIIDQRGYGNNDHDIERLVVDARSLNIAIPQWIDDNSYEISKWATTIRYNSNFKTNRDNLLSYISMTESWLKILSY